MTKLNLHEEEKLADHKRQDPEIQAFAENAEGLQMRDVPPDAPALYDGVDLERHREQDDAAGEYLDAATAALHRSCQLARVEKCHSEAYNDPYVREQ